jgi:hypothetical protein
MFVRLPQKRAQDCLLPMAPFRNVRRAIFQSAREMGDHALRYEYVPPFMSGAGFLRSTKQVGH